MALHPAGNMGAVPSRLEIIQDGLEEAVTKIPIQNKMPQVFLYKGERLVPMTEEQAASLRIGDVIRYIGSINTRAYGDVGRKNIILEDKPSYNPKYKRLSFLAWGCYRVSSRFSDWSIISLGNKDKANANRGKVFISKNLRGFKRDLQALASRTIKRIDGHLEKLPLHMKMELFRDLPEKEKIIYDFIYKDFEKVIGLKEDPGEA